MKIRIKPLLAATAILILLAVVMLFCFPSLSENLPAPLARAIAKARSRAQPLTDRQKMFLDSFKTSIELYGRVEDQNGVPVADAKITLYPIDTPWGEYSKGETTLISDSTGGFHIKGLHGTSMGVSARKDGYLEIDLTRGLGSHSMVDYAGGAKDGLRHRNPKTPLVLRIHKIGPTEPLVYVKDRRLRLPVDGTPKNIALDDDKGNGPHKIEFRFATDWAKIPKDSDEVFGRFSWKLEVSIPGGGFVLNRSDYAFEAPESGYEERIVIEFHKDDAKWEKFVKRRYFVKFPDGTFARIRFAIDADSDGSPLMMTSWMNLRPGSRNLASEMQDGSRMADE